MYNIILVAADVICECSHIGISIYYNFGISIFSEIFGRPNFHKPPPPPVRE